MGDEWRRVRVQAPQAYDAFLEGLVREDLALFFRHLMREEDREGFWLRYLGSFRRTLCVLDPGAYENLNRRLTGAPEAARGALERVERTLRADVDGTSAFCLLFDDFVMVEFSLVGNAGFLYARDAFEDDLRAKLRAGRLQSPASLKRLPGLEGRLLHFRGWEERMGYELLRRRVLRD